MERWFSVRLRREGKDTIALAPIKDFQQFIYGMHSKGLEVLSFMPIPSPETQDV